MQQHELTRATPRKKASRVGRGGKRGKTAGRGTKGQKARAGHRMRPELRDIIKKFPKLRGYRFKSFQTKAVPVNLSALSAAFADGDVVSVAALLEKNVVSKRGGRAPKVKILGNGSIDKKLTIAAGVLISGTAKAAIEKAGGTIAA
jgi:large subunit ribosomal protein L15